MRAGERRVEAGSRASGLGESMAYKFYNRIADRPVLLAAVGIAFLSLAFWSIAIDAIMHFDLSGLF